MAQITIKIPTLSDIKNKRTAAIVLATIGLVIADFLKDKATFDNGVLILSLIALIISVKKDLTPKVITPVV